MWITDYDETNDKRIRDWEEFESLAGEQRDHTDDIYRLTDADGIPRDDDEGAVVVTGPDWEYDVLSCDNYPEVY